MLKHSQHAIFFRFFHRPETIDQCAHRAHPQEVILLAQRTTRNAIFRRKQMDTAVNQRVRRRQPQKLWV